MQKARWSIAVAAAALLALPIATFAQSSPSTPTQNPPSQQQPPAQPPAQPPSQPPATTTPPPSAQADATSARDHLSKARDTLSSLTSMPEAAKLQGDARTQVSQLISNFNGLISAQTDWRGEYAKVDANLTSLLGPAAAATPAPDQPVGTSGTAGLDPAIRAKLTEFRTHLKAFEAAAGAPAAASASGSMPPSAPTSSTTNPANPTSPDNPANPSNPTAAAAPASPAAAMDPADRARASAEVDAAAKADAQKELDAITAILDKSKTGALTKAQATELRRHVETLRVLMAQK